MSKRSYRRLAAVTGAALAIGAMAPAMAAHLDSSGGASVSADPGLGISGITGLTDALPPVGLPTGLISTVTGTALSTAQAAPALALGDVSDIVGDVRGIGGGLLATPGSSVLGANAGAGVLGSGVGVNGTVSAPLGIVGGALGAPGVLAGDAFGVVGQAQGIAGPVVGTALSTVGTVPGTALGLPGTVLGTAGLLTGGLNGILSPSGNVNVLASLMGGL